MAIVLVVSTDDHLAMTRRLIIEKAGHRVIAASTAKQVESACRNNDIEVVVIGQGIDRAERMKIRDTIRANCRTCKILELYRPFDGKSLEDADDWLEVPTNTPPRLAERVTALAN